MPHDALFIACNVIGLVGWATLVLAPRWRVTQWLIATHLLPLLIAGVYIAILIVGIALGGHSEGGFGSLDAIAQLFESRSALLAGWIHFIAFDLFLGGWQLRDAQRLGIHHLWVVPCLLATLYIGPVGLALYVVVRRLTAGTWKAAEAIA